MLMRRSRRCVVFNNACVARCTDRFILCGDDHQAFQASISQLIMSTFNKQSIDIAVIELCRISCRVGDCVRAEYSYKQV